MRTLATKQPSNQDSAHQKPVRTAPVPVARSLSTALTGSAMLQRKPSCACGGGCPRCQETALLQTKLKINEPGDRYEQEADHIADRVMRMPEPSIQRQIEPEEEEEEGMVQREAISNQVISSNSKTDSSEAPPIVHAVLNSPGQPLDPKTRTFMEPRFGHNFSQVRVHSDGMAAKSAQMFNARAFTVKHDIIFDAGQYAPQTSEGRGLLAHELAHVIQQASPPTTSLPSLQRAPRERKLLYPLWSDLPEPLQTILDISCKNNSFDRCTSKSGIDLEMCFNQLDHKIRFVLLSLYRNFDRLGLWSYIKYVTGIWSEGSGGVKFVVQDPNSLAERVISNIRLCRDTRLSGLLHPGGHSFREVAAGYGLHLSLGEAGLLTAHVDRISPVASRGEGGFCVADPTQSLAHLGREVIPDIIGKKLKLPPNLSFLEIFPEQIPTGKPSEREDITPSLINLLKVTWGQ